MIERLFPNYILTSEDALDFLPRWIDMLGGDQLDGMIADERVGADGTSWHFLFRHDKHPGHENDPGHDGKQTHLHWLENSNRLGSPSASLADIAALVASFHTDLGPRK